MQSATIRDRVPALGAPWLDRPWVTVAFGVVVAILTWDPQPLVPVPGGDPSWMLGLQLAAEAGLDQGTEFVFTYGPLGFLEPAMVVDGGLATLSAVYAVALRAALGASLLWAARRSLPWLPAALLAFTVAAIAPRVAGSVALALTTLWCLAALQAPAPPWTRNLVVFGGAALAALEVLVKLNIGVTIFALVVVTALALPGSRLRNLLTLAVTFAGVYLLLWFASGQGLGNLDDYMRSAYEIVSGYSDTMQHEAGAASWDWLAALLVGIATLAATAVAAAREPAGRAVALLVVVALLLFSLEKFAFVRHEAGSVGAYFEGLIVVWVALRWRGAARLVPVAALAVIAIVYFGAAKGAAEFTVRPALALDQLRTLVVPGERAQARDEARAALRASYAVDPRIIRRIGDAPVDVRPWEIGLIWAYDLNWRPLPVIQDYQAYTPRLDRLNAEALASGDGPRFILRHFGYADTSVVGLDGRFTSFDSPLAVREMLCRFRPLLTLAPYQLLVRTTDRCGEPRRLRTETAAFGESVAVPASGPGEAVFVGIEGAEARGIERLRALAYKPALRRIILGEGSAPLPVRNAESGLLISAPTAADFPAPFALAPNVDEIAVDSEGGFATSDGSLRFEFYAVPVRPER